MTRTFEFANHKTSVDRLPESLQSLIFLLSQTSNITSSRVAQCLLQANVNRVDLINWATFNHPVADSYGRRLVYDGGYFEIMVMSWMPGDVSAIHDHGQAQWGAVQCFGRAIHTIYSFIEGKLSTEAEIPLFPSQIVQVNHSLIHQMSNCSQERFLSLHVYGCYDRQDIITGDTRIFDLLEGKIQYTNGGVFFCLPEAEISRRGQHIEADRLTTLQHHQQMRDRLTRILENSDANRGDWQLKLDRLNREIKELFQQSSLIG